jgi:Zn-dependent peptidase ImmA (M78 family)
VIRFIAEAQIEARAAEFHQRFGLTPAFDVEWLVDQVGLRLLWEELPDEEGGKMFGQLWPEAQTIVLNERHREELEGNDGAILRFTIGHEIGHWILHAEAIRSGTISMAEDGRIWCRDKSAHPIERQAEMFSAALLINQEQLRAEIPKHPWRGWAEVRRLATEFRVSQTAMVIRLEKLGWAHRAEDGQPVSGPASAAGQATLFA